MRGQRTSDSGNREKDGTRGVFIENVGRLMLYRAPAKYRLAYGAFLRTRVGGRYTQQAPIRADRTPDFRGEISPNYLIPKFGYAWRVSHYRE